MPTRMPRHSSRHRRRTSPRRLPPCRIPTTLINKLKELAALKDQGILTEAEFNDQKTKILAEMS